MSDYLTHQLFQLKNNLRFGMADLSFTDGEYIFREGESAEFAYIVKSGEVQITKITATGEDSLAVIKNPTLFGEMALIDGSPRSAGARAIGDTVVTEVTSAAFSQYIKIIPMQQSGS